VGLLILFTQYSEFPLLYPKDGGKMFSQKATCLAAIGNHVSDDQRNMSYTAFVIS